jgi:hypothetical protein
VVFYTAACLSSYQRTDIYTSIAVVTQTAAGAHVSFFTPRINQFTGSLVCFLFVDLAQPMPIFAIAAVPYRVSRPVPLLHFRILRYAAHHS